MSGMILERTYMDTEKGSVYHIINLNPVEVKTRCGIDWSRGVWLNSPPKGKRLCKKCRRKGAK